MLCGQIGISCLTLRVSCVFRLLIFTFVILGAVVRRDGGSRVSVVRLDSRPQGGLGRKGVGRRRGLCDPADLPFPVGRLGRREG